MDSRLRRNVEPQLRAEDTWDQMVAVAERYNPTMYRTGGYKGSDRSQAASSKTHTPKKENTYRKASTTSTPRSTGKGKARLRRGPIPSPTSQVRMKWTAARQKEPVSSVAKAVTLQMNAQRKKLRPTVFTSLRKAPTAAKANMSPIQTVQRS